MLASNSRLGMAVGQRFCTLIRALSRNGEKSLSPMVMGMGTWVGT